MGQGTSREAKAKPKFNGVRLSRSLGKKLGLAVVEINDIDNKDTFKDHHQSKENVDIVDTPSSEPVSRLDKRLHQDTKNLIQRNRVLSDALDLSAEINGLLLIREEEELRKIEDLSNAILKKEETEFSLVNESYQVPCAEIKDRVIACYRENKDQTYKCRQLVSEYSKCSRLAAFAS
eukprot:jgi/Picsp_1/5999/NSC_03353-R1_---NA---